MKNLFSLWQDVNSETFYIEENKIRYTKNQIDEKIKKLDKILHTIADLGSKTVYLDIKDRLLFIIAFFTLLKINSKIVLVPHEVKPEDYFHKGGIFISDNKTHEEFLFVNKDLTVKCGENFSIEHLDKTEDQSDASIYLYTSGSTGKAKLIPKNPINLISEAEELKKIFKVDENTIFYFTPPICHIYGFLFGLLLPVYASAKLIIDYIFTPESICKFVSENKIDVFVSIPSYYRMFVDLNLISSFKNCRHLTSSSAPLPLDVSKIFYDSGISITEVYGSTETGGIAHRISAANQEWKLFSYVSIIDDWKDYLSTDNKDEKIIELKTVSPAISVFYNKTEGFNTGDVVKFNSKDSFVLLGRNTRFVKISGKRVDLGYVLEKFKEYLIHENSRFIKDEEIYIGEYKGKIYIICEREFPKNSKDMKDDLKKHLPGYAIPRFFIHTKIPKNPMGKINKVKIDEIIYDKYKNEDTIN